MSNQRAPFRLFLAICLLWPFVLSGCGNNPYPPGESTKSVYYRYIPEPPRHLDPTQSNFEVDADLIYSVYATYYKYDYLKHDKYTLVLSLGASEPVKEQYRFTTTVGGKKVQRVGESWTFHIIHSLRFQDDPCFPGGKGREILASDFLYAFRRMADPELNSPGASFVGDKIIGFSDYMDYCTKRDAKKLPMDYNAPVEGLQADPKDPYTFRILVNQPYPEMRYLMAMCYTTPIAHEAIEKYKDLEQHPVGSGMYVMSRIEPKSRWILTKNPNRPVQYYPSDGTDDDRRNGLLEDAGKQLPLNDEVQWELIPETVTSWNLFLQGYQDPGIDKPDELQPSRIQTGQGQLRNGTQGHVDNLRCGPYSGLLCIQYDRSIGGRFDAKEA